ncbi:protein phosphatase 1H-like [Orbicella faveolata]|uniref:protein phosphatase 1H-like n=1 Tax=Orbicella faveolata TaxID=48498 RepID=UPI0009E5E190|nr:protein phosphatase 1H-like [Orbicella faveolata]
MSFNGLRRMLNINTANALAYFTNVNSDRRLGFRVYDDMLDEKYTYRRPEFLQLNEESEQAASDHESRPIIIPHRELPFNAGYAETINAGKTPHKNEDQSVTGMFCLNVSKSTSESTESEGSPEHVTQIKIPYAYFGIFDGHAGCGAALMAVNQLHIHIMEKLQGVKDLLAYENDEKLAMAEELAEAVVSSVTIDSLVIGVLEEAFFEMDEQIRREKVTYRIDGGCAALVALFLGKRLYVANAGDCRAILAHKGKVVPLSKDFTPESERQRVQLLAYQRPQLLGSDFGRLEFQQRARKKHIGQKLLYRDRHMTGWALKTVTEEDTRKFPMINGEGKKARLLDTIGTTRGFGDHDLKVAFCSLPIKPFLTPQPEVRKFDLSNSKLTEDDVVIMASDGLWERLSSEKAALLVMETFSKVPKEDKRRYAMAAQALVGDARGTLTEKGWRRTNGELASYDDISAFVIPISECSSEMAKFTVEYDKPTLKPTHSLDNEED